MDGRGVAPAPAIPSDLIGPRGWLCGPPGLHWPGRKGLVTQPEGGLQGSSSKFLRLASAAAIGVALLAALIPARSPRPLERAITAAFEAGELPGLDAALVIFRGKTIAEVYFDDAEERSGWLARLVPRASFTPHDMRSISKSVTALLYGIALDEGKVPPPDAPLLAQFPEYADLAGDPLRDSITIADALSMKMGTEWDETLPYASPKNSETMMEHAPDRYRFALDRPMVAQPGTQWSYSGGAAALIAKLISDGTGMTLDAYAEEKLLRPLGISRWEWRRGWDGVPMASSGLRLTARDLARIGTLVLEGGTYDGRRLVPRGWLDQVFTPRANLDGVRYGYFWWLADARDPRAWVSVQGSSPSGPQGWPHWVAGLGNGGQRLSVQPDIGLIVVILASNYDAPDDWVMPERIIRDHIAPDLRRRLGE